MLINSKFIAHLSYSLRWTKSRNQLKYRQALGSVCLYAESLLSELVVDASALELSHYHKITVIFFASPCFSLSFSNIVISSFSVTLFFRNPFWAAWINAFSMPIAFYGLTSLILMTELLKRYVGLWLQGKGFGRECPDGTLRLAWGN